MMKLLSILVLGLCSKLAAASFPAKVAGEIAGGIVEAFIGASDVQACIQNTVTEVGSFEDAIKEFEKKTPGAVLKGLKLLAEAFKALPDDLKACKAVESDVQEISMAFAQMSSPKAFAFHVSKDLVVNHDDIFREIYTAVSDYSEQKWQDFGIQVGTALHKLIIGAEAKFEEFERKFSKVYSQEERQHRFEIFTENCMHMKQIHRLEKGSAVYSHLTPFADLSREEVMQRNGFYAAGLSQQHSMLHAAEPLSVSGLPDRWDWRDAGAVNPVKSQGDCGACWAFATVANIEGAGFVENKRLLSLSEQELVDCDKKDWGCQGGLPSWAYDNMIANHLGLETESNYPYTGNATATCSAKQSSEKAFINGWVNVSIDEDQIAAALMKYGPLAIGINAGLMQLYHSGVAHPDNSTCNPVSLNHGVNIVGFGIDNGTKYWTIRNSWGPTWGESGYYRIVRGTGACGLNSAVTSAINITFVSDLLV